MPRARRSEAAPDAQKPIFLDKNGLGAAPKTLQTPKTLFFQIKITQVNRSEAPPNAKNSIFVEKKRRGGKRADRPSPQVELNKSQREYLRGVFGFEYVENIFSLFLSPEKLRQKKKRAILQNFNSGMLKLTKTPILPNCQVSDNFFLNLIIQDLKFCEIAQLYICLRNTGCCLYYYSVNHQYTHI